MNTTEELLDMGGVEVPEEVSLDVPSIVRLHGYSCEEIRVTTTDGFQLTMFRLQNFDVAEKSISAARPVVLLQHGLLVDAAVWVSNGPKDSLAFMLADAGFDVYLANSRGNRYSRDHVSLKPNEAQFWKWSWQEIAKYDLPATINAALEKSQQKNLYYIGHSQGTLIMFAHLSECFPEEARKIRCFFALAPITRLKCMKSPIRHLAALKDIAELGQWMLGGAGILPNTEAGRWFTTQMHKFVKSTHKSIEDRLIDSTNNLVGILSGFNPSHYFRQYLPVYAAHTPSGTSLQNIIHYGQMVKDQQMQKYDYQTENMHRYLSTKPPVFELKNVKVATLIYYGTDDNLSDTVDVEWTIEQLPNVVEHKKLDGWDHLDFLYGTLAPNYLYTEIIDFIKDASSNFER